ncbi:unnamed protein product [Lota lota]
MITRNLLLLVLLCLSEGLCTGASANRSLRRRGVGGPHATKQGENRAAGQWDTTGDANGMPVGTLRNLIGRDQEAEGGSVSYAKMLQSHAAASLANKERLGSKPKREVESVNKQEVTHASGNNREPIPDLRARNNTKNDETTTKTGKVEKAFVIRYKNDLRSNKTRFRPGARSRARPDPGDPATGAPARFNLTGSYGVLELLSKESLVRIVNSQMQSFQSKGSRSRKRDLIDVNSSHSDAGRAQRQDVTVAQSHPGLANQTALPNVRPATNADPGADHSVYPRPRPFSQTLSSLAKAADDGARSKESPRSLSTPHSEFGAGKEKQTAASQTQPPLPPSAKHLPQHVPLQENGSASLALPLQPPRAKPGAAAGGDPRGEQTETETVGSSDTEPSASRFPSWGPQTKPGQNGSHVLKLRPDPQTSRESEGGGGGGGGGGVTAVNPGAGSPGGLVFEEAESDEGEEEEEEARGGEKEEEEEEEEAEVQGARSRSRRSWIWNQFFVIEEYAGPEPVLIGRLHTDMDRKDGRTKYVLRGEGAGSVFVIDEKTGNIHVTKPLDREEKDEYRLIATATDRQTERALEPSSQFIIRVQDINDNPPVFDDGPYSATVPEMANIGTSIIQVTATDADDPTYGNSARLVYTLVQGQQYFSVDPQTGTLRTAVPDLDRESQDQFLVVLQAKDMGGHLGGLSGTTTVTIRLTDVNDNPPRFTQSDSHFQMLWVTGDIHLIVNHSDLCTKSLLLFLISRSSGDLTYHSPSPSRVFLSLHRRSAAVDYESRSSYSFSVEVLNPIVDPRFLRRGPFKDRASIRVAVLDADEPPRFSRTRYLMDVSENCPPACTVGRVSAVDPDTGLTNNIRFSIDPQSDPEALFRITPDSGLITTAMELDREREHWHNITIIATQRDNPSQVSRVLVAIETLDLNDNPPELDRQYTTAMCDSASSGQVVQVLRAIDRDEGGNDSTVYFSIPPESSAALNFSVRDSGGTACCPLTCFLHSVSMSLSHSLSLSLALSVSLSLSHSLSLCLYVSHSLSLCLSVSLSLALSLSLCLSLSLSLSVTGLSLSLRRQKRDSLSPLEEDDVRENIITYDDEGGGEADTAAFDIAALQSAPHSSRTRGYRTLDSRNVRYSQHSQDKARTYSWAQHPGADPNYPGPGGGALYGRLCYSSHTLPVLRRGPAGAPFEQGVAEPGYRIPGGSGVHPDHSLVIQNQAATVGTTESGAAFVSPTERNGGGGGRKGSRADSRDGAASQGRVSTSDGGTPRTDGGRERGGAGAGGGASSSCTTEGSGEEKMNGHSQGGDWVQSQTLPRDQHLVLTRSGSVMGQGAHGIGGWVCDSSTLPLAGRRASRAVHSPKRGGSGQAGESESGGAGGGGGGANGNGKASGGTPTENQHHQQQGGGTRNYAAGPQGEVSGPRDYAATLGRGGLELSRLDRDGSEGGLLLSGGAPPVYPEGAGFMGDWRERVGLGGYVLARRDMSPQMLPFPGQARGLYGGGGGMGFGAGWVPGMEPGVRGIAPGPGGGPSLALRVGEFLRLRLAQVTFDPTQPPYDSVQVYGLEGSGSRAGSLSSLESEGGGEKEDWGSGLEDWGPQFQKLAQLFKEREKEKEAQEQEKKKKKEDEEAQGEKKRGAAGGGGAGDNKKKKKRGEKEEHERKEKAGDGGTAKRQEVTV